MRTNLLDLATLSKQLRSVCNFCGAIDPIGLDVSYGWACDLEQDDLYVDHRIESASLSDFIGQSVERGAFILGESDLHIRGATVDFSFTLCHESDIHFESGDANLVNRITDAWTADGIGFYAVK